MYLLCAAVAAVRVGFDILGWLRPPRLRALKRFFVCYYDDNDNEEDSTLFLCIIYRDDSNNDEEHSKQDHTMGPHKPCTHRISMKRTLLSLQQARPMLALYPRLWGLRHASVHRPQALPSLLASLLPNVRSEGESFIFWSSYNVFKIQYLTQGGHFAAEAERRRYH